jgi:hypothetical protein
MPSAVTGYSRLRIRNNLLIASSLRLTGLDVSPAVRHYLGMTHNELTYWRFADETDVPGGPWTETVTTSGNNR